MRIVFLGSPGAGKGTQAEGLFRDLELAHISTGDLLRKEVAEGSPIGRKAEAFMKSGSLVPDEIVIEMVRDRIRRPDARPGYLLDGFPRNVAQAVALDASLEPSERIDRVFYFDLPDAVAIERLSGRFTCRKCGRVYNVSSAPPKQAGRCDVCAGELYQRDDDKPETVRRRLEVYRKETAGLVRHYEEQGRLVRIDAARAPEEVAQALRREVRALA